MSDQAAGTNLTSIAELEGGIFNFVISLCQAHATTMGVPAAKAKVADHLQALVVGLRTPDPTNPLTEEQTTP